MEDQSANDEEQESGIRGRRLHPVEKYQAILNTNAANFYQIMAVLNSLEEHYLNAGSQQL